jgi:hypothetical protein
MNNTYFIKDIVVRDSLWGDLGTIALLTPGASQPLALKKGRCCADCKLQVQGMQFCHGMR